MRFSERIGVKPVRNVVQLDMIDKPLLGALWTAFHESYVSTEISNHISTAAHGKLYRVLWLEFFKEPIDTIPSDTNILHKLIRDWFFKAPWPEVYDFIEFVALYGRPSGLHERYITSVNYYLKRELSAYRLIDRRVTPITSDQELGAIEDAIASTDKAGIKGASRHLRQALALLSDRATPDYRNSIKESISAIESVARALSGEEKAELGKALRTLEAKIPMHGALRTAFSSMYGYTSDEQGIRHAMMDEPNLDIEDAVFMLVSCSAFVNYLLAKSTKVGIAFS